MGPHAIIVVADDPFPRMLQVMLDPLYEEPSRADDELLAFDNVIVTPHIAAQPRFNALSDFADLFNGAARAPA